MKTLNLSKEEKEEVLIYLIELFRDSGHEVLYLDDPMATLMDYLDFYVPQTLKIKDDNGEECTVTIK